MKRLSVLVVAIILSSCQMPVGDLRYDPQYVEIPSPILAPGASTPLAIGRWVANYVDGVSDLETVGIREYWQTPAQTYARRAGDCEDFSLLMMYLLRRDLGGWPEMAGGEHGGVGHAWVIYEGRWYEPQTGRDVTGADGYELERTIPYGEAMYRAATVHRALASTVLDAIGLTVH